MTKPFNDAWRADMETVERLIDSHGLSTVVDMLAQISYEKAAHLTSTWQDNASAKVWSRDAAKLLRVSGKLELQPDVANGRRVGS